MFKVLFALNSTLVISYTRYNKTVSTVIYENLNKNCLLEPSNNKYLPIFHGMAGKKHSVQY